MFAIVIYEYKSYHDQSPIYTSLNLNMSLDFHISNSRSDAVKTYPDHSMDEETHESLAVEWKKTDKPFLKRVSDYYTDAAYQGGDIVALLAELETADSKLPAVIALTKLCKQAQSANKNLYIFAD